MKLQTPGIIFLFIVTSLAMLLFILWLVDFSQFNIPALIPGTQLSIYGSLFLIGFILIFIFLQKRLLKFNAQTSFSTLLIASAIVAFTSLFFYQMIRQLIILRGQYAYNLFSVLQSSAIPSMLLILVAASIGLELKKVKSILRHVPMAILLILILLTRQYLHLIEW